jgi:hypothetical protein
VRNDGPTGSYYLQWFPADCCCNDKDKITKYTIYGRQGTSTVTPLQYDQIFFVSADTHFFLTPNIGTSNWSFIVSSSNQCGESLPSETFNTYDVQ